MLLGISTTAMLISCEHWLFAFQVAGWESSIYALYPGACPSHQWAVSLASLRARGLPAACDSHPAWVWVGERTQGHAGRGGVVFLLFFFSTFPPLFCFGSLLQCNPPPPLTLHNADFVSTQAEVAVGVTVIPFVCRKLPSISLVKNQAGILW